MGIGCGLSRLWPSSVSLYPCICRKVVHGGLPGVGSVPVVVVVAVVVARHRVVAVVVLPAGVGVAWVVAAVVVLSGAVDVTWRVIGFPTHRSGH